MDEIISCPNCHQPVKPIDFFCANCGKKIRTPPLSTSLSSQIFLYLKTLLLPPLGFIWGFRYLSQSDTKSKLIGSFVILITLIETIWLIQSTVKIIDVFNQQILQQSGIYGF